tara:strand:- start:985 stop:1644 length:660 start_codon:yes stop_codon:yes gene_type:complete
MDYESLKKEFEKNKLHERGLKLPREETLSGQTLLYLYQNKGQIVRKAEAESIVCARLGLPKKDLQALRHLGKQSGFNILQQNETWKGKKLKRGEYVLVDLKNINHYFKIKRRDESDLNFSSIKKKYNYQCATCGAREGKKHRWTKQIVSLEKGHMDPEQPMTNDNIIPQCSYCNQTVKDKFVFDRMGFPKEITIEGLLSHDKEKLEQFQKIIEERLRGL